MKPYKVLTINPGSTSTKVALFQGEECLYSQTVSQEAKELEQYASMSEQLPYRRDTVLTLLKEAGIGLEEVDVFVGRGGGLIAMEGGTYGVTDLMLEHARTCANGVIHPAALGSQLANEFAQAYGAKAMVVNPPDVDASGPCPHDRHPGRTPHHPPPCPESEGNSYPAQQKRDEETIRGVQLCGMPYRRRHFHIRP